MAGQWKEIVDTSFKINGKALTSDGITIGKDDIAGLNNDLTTLNNSITALNGDLSGLNTDIGNKVDKTFKIGNQALTGSSITLVEASIPTLSIGKITGLQAGLDSKVPTSRKINGKTLTADVSLVKGDVGLGNVENKSSATIRSEIVVANIPSDIPISKISGLDDSLSILRTDMNGMNGDINTINNTPINGKLLKNGAITLETQDLIPQKTTLPTTGVAGQMVRSNNKVYLWKESV